jgi:hypothetical protein
MMGTTNLGQQQTNMPRQDVYYTQQQPNYSNPTSIAQLQAMYGARPSGGEVRSAPVYQPPQQQLQQSQQQLRYNPDLSPSQMQMYQQAGGANMSVDQQQNLLRQIAPPQQQTSGGIAGLGQFGQQQTGGGLAGAGQSRLNELLQQAQQRPPDAGMQAAVAGFHRDEAVANSNGPMDPARLAQLQANAAGQAGQANLSPQQQQQLFQNAMNTYNPQGQQQYQAAMQAQRSPTQQQQQYFTPQQYRQDPYMNYVQNQQQAMQQRFMQQNSLQQTQQAEIARQQQAAQQAARINQQATQQATQQQYFDYNPGGSPG